MSPRSCATNWWDGWPEKFSRGCMQRSELALLMSSWLCSDQVGSGGSKMARHRSSWLWRVQDGSVRIKLALDSSRWHSHLGGSHAILAICVVGGVVWRVLRGVGFPGCVRRCRCRCRCLYRCRSRSPVLRGSVLCGPVASKVSKIDGYPQHRWLIPGLTIDHVPQRSVLANQRMEPPKTSVQQPGASGKKPGTVEKEGAHPEMLWRRTDYRRLWSIIDTCAREQPSIVSHNLR